MLLNIIKAFLKINVYWTNLTAHLLYTYRLYKKFIFYSNVILNINRKSVSTAPAAEGTLWNFIPAGRLGYYLARRVCVYQSSPFCDHREKAREIERKRG